MTKGLTLIEIMVSVSIFLVVMTVAMGAIFSISNANGQTESLKSVMDNLNFAIESISREIRFGKNYHCGSGGDVTSPQNCVAGDTSISFLSSDNHLITYNFLLTAITKATDGGLPLAVTGTDVTITSVIFYVLGANPAPGDLLQPYVIIKLKGYAGNKPSVRSNFVIQTMMSERVLDKLP